MSEKQSCLLPPPGTDVVTRVDQVGTSGQGRSIDGESLCKGTHLMLTVQGGPAAHHHATESMFVGTGSPFPAAAWVLLSALTPRGSPGRLCVAIAGLHPDCLQVLPERPLLVELPADNFLLQNNEGLRD